MDFYLFIKKVTSTILNEFLSYFIIFVNTLINAGGHSRKSVNLVSTQYTFHIQECTTSFLESECTLNILIRSVSKPTHLISKYQKSIVNARKILLHFHYCPQSRNPYVLNKHVTLSWFEQWLTNNRLYRKITLYSLFSCATMSFTKLI